MTHWMRTCSLALALLLGTGSAHADEKTPLVLGIFPYVTPVQLAQFHAPLKDYLAKALQRPVTLVTAPDFMTFVDRTRDGQYDMLFTAPHLGRLAETRDGYRRLAQTGHNVQGIFLTRKDSAIQKIEDLKGKKVMIAQNVSIIYQMAEQTLREKGLVPGETVTIIETRTHNNAIHAPVRGEADASVTGQLLWYGLDEKQKEQLRVFATTAEAPGFLFMAHPRVSAQDVETIRKLLLNFHKTPNGEAYFTTTGLGNFHPVDERTMKALDPYIQIFLKPAKP